MAIHQHIGKKWYREPWPWLLMAGPGLVVIAGIVTAWLAVVSNDGLVSDDYYKQGLAVNQRLQRDHSAQDMGLQADLMRSGSGVRVLLSRGAEGSLPDLLILKFAHPTQAGHDQTLQMHSEGRGLYVGDLSADIEGRWKISIEDPSGQWRLQGDWVLEADSQIHLSASN